MLCCAQVHGKSGQYLTLVKSYCSCQAHYYEVVAKGEALYVSNCGAEENSVQCLQRPGRFRR